MNHKRELNIPRVFRIATIDVSPPAQTIVHRMLGIEERLLLTIQDYFHIVHETVDNLQDVRLHHASLVLGEPVQSA